MKKKLQSEKIKSKSICLSPQDWQELAEYSNKTGIPQSKVVKFALSAYFKENNKTAEC